MTVLSILIPDLSLRGALAVYPVLVFHSTFVDTNDYKIVMSLDTAGNR